MSAEGKDMIKRLLTLDPKKRISTTEALEHPWMKDEEVVGKAKKIMETAATSLSMPPPPQLPVSEDSLFSLPCLLSLSLSLFLSFSSSFPSYSLSLSPSPSISSLLAHSLLTLHMLSLSYLTAHVHVYT